VVVVVEEEGEKEEGARRKGKDSGAVFRLDHCWSRGGGEGGGSAPVGREKGRRDR